MVFFICSFGGALVWGSLHLGERSFRGASGGVKGLHPLVHLGERSFRGARVKRFHRLVHFGERYSEKV